MPAEALLSRALAYLSEHGSASPAELARCVFGGEAFAPLLTSLGGRLQFDGAVWRLAPLADEIAFLEILATGPNPGRHRIVELAAQRREARFHALIASRQPVPKLLRKLGVPEQADDWLSLDQIRQELQTFVGHATIVGFGYVPEFLDQLLGPRWPAIDLLRLVRGSGFDGRPDPQRLARHFGLRSPAD